MIAAWIIGILVVFGILIACGDEGDGDEIQP